MKMSSLAWDKESTVWESTGWTRFWQSTVSGDRFCKLCTTHLGRGVYTLGVYSLGQPALEIVEHHLGLVVYSLRVYSLGIYGLRVYVFMQTILEMWLH